MSVKDILEAAQFIIDKEGQQTGVLLDLSSWEALQKLLENIEREDELLGQLMLDVEDNEALSGKDAVAVYKSLLAKEK
ncbi:MAG: hypothetical protein AAF985_24730 [Bacteroidota bacterium]